MKSIKNHLVASFLTLSLPLVAGCGDAAETSAEPTGIWCLPGLDGDGDGVADHHEIGHTILATDERACREEHAGAVLGGVPIPPAEEAPEASPAWAGGDTGPTFVEGGSLPEDLQKAVDWSGIAGGKWVPDVYDCDDFAGHLEEHLQAKGYYATFTLIATDADGDGYYDPAFDHAITDVHIGTTTYWIEPQTGKQIVLDTNGDGKVSTTKKDSWRRYASEDATSITVFESRADAEAAGYPMD